MDEEAHNSQLANTLAALRASPLRTANGVSSAQREAVREILFDALKNGSDYRTAARALRKGFPQLSFDVALAIAWTELARAQNMGAVMWYRQTGTKHVRWSAAQDERTCVQCRRLDGQVAPINGAFRDGTKPGELPHECCRCCILAED